MKSTFLAHAVPSEALLKALEWVQTHGTITEPLLRRAVRDAAILSYLRVNPGRYAEAAGRYGVTENAAREVESLAKKLERPM